MSRSAGFRCFLGLSSTVLLLVAPVWADSAAIDETVTDEGEYRYCIEVTNDGQNDEDADDNDECISSFHFQFEFCHTFPDPWSGRDEISQPDGWDSKTHGSSNREANGQGKRYTRYVAWETDDDTKEICPGETGDKPFCFVATEQLCSFWWFTDFEKTLDDGTTQSARLTTATVQGWGGEDEDEDHLEDADGDGLPDAFERDSDPTLADTDGDGLGDAEDNCRNHPDPDQTDSDQDRLGDLCDPCPDAADCDGDGLSDAREVRVTGTDPRAADTDGDGLDDAAELAHPNDPSDPNNPLSTPEVLGDGVDNDAFGLVDEDFDADDDFLQDLIDNCPFTPNPFQLDADGDGEGDACDIDDLLIHFTAFDGPLVFWQEDTSYVGYVLYRCSLADLRETGTFCDPGSDPFLPPPCPPQPETSFHDDSILLPGEALFLLVSGVNADGVEGSLGHQSNGDERVPVAPGCP